MEYLIIIIKTVIVAATILAALIVAFVFVHNSANADIYDDDYLQDLYGDREEGGGAK